MRNLRQQLLDRACLRVLLNCGDYLLPDAALREHIAIAITPPPTTSELDDTIKHQDTSRRILGLLTEHGTKWKLTDSGRAWLAEFS